MSDVISLSAAVIIAVAYVVALTALLEFGVIVP